jgi:hypothetical protein
MGGRVWYGKLGRMKRFGETLLYWGLVGSLAGRLGLKNRGKRVEPKEQILVVKVGEPCKLCSYMPACMW